MTLIERLASAAAEMEMDVDGRAARVARRDVGGGFRAARYGTDSVELVAGGSAGGAGAAEDEVRGVGSGERWKEGMDTLCASALRTGVCGRDGGGGTWCVGVGGCQRCGVAILRCAVGKGVGNAAQGLRGSAPSAFGLGTAPLLLP